MQTLSKFALCGLLALVSTSALAQATSQTPPAGPMPGMMMQPGAGQAAPDAQAPPQQGGMMSGGMMECPMMKRSAQMASSMEQMQKQMAEMTATMKQMQEQMNRTR